MAKKKLSRDQKRKLKKQKRKKQQGLSNANKFKVVEPFLAGNFDEQEKRIKQVFGTDEIPEVGEDTLRIYFNYLVEHLELPCLLTGIESMGYFGWEERFEFGYGSKADYERERKVRGSYHDQYELKEWEVAIEPGRDIWVKVRRISDGQYFTIPLSELEAVDQTSSNHDLLNDYTVWIVNWL